MVLPMVSELFHDIKDKSKDDDEDKGKNKDDDEVLQHEYLGQESSIVYCPRRQVKKINLKAGLNVE